MAGELDDLAVWCRCDAEYVERMARKFASAAETRKGQARATLEARAADVRRAAAAIREAGQAAALLAAYEGHEEEGPSHAA
jgi:hypothetical protein